MFTANFWKQTTERFVKSAAQALVGLWIGDGFNVWIVDWRLATGVAAGAAMLSVLTSIITAGVGERDSPSAVTIDRDVRSRRM